MPDSIDSSSALKEKNFLMFTLGSLVAMVGRQMLTVAVGWDIYEKTHSAMALGYIGLAQFLPVLLLTLPAGQVADRYDRRKVLIFAQIVGACAGLGLLLLSLYGNASHASVVGMYLCLVLAGIGRAFHSPANAAILPQVVSEKNFTNAVTWGSITYQASAILGPGLGGLMIALYHRASTVYLIDFICCLIFGLLLTVIRSKPKGDLKKSTVTLKTMLSGVEFVWKTKIILAAITLDMFAVLFGGAIALLPVYAKDILHVGPTGLGWLQAAPSIGAIAMGLFLSRLHNFRRSGAVLLWAVIGFGIATIIFGFSTNFWLSFAMLVLTGVFDNVSVVIRQALVQLRTPDDMRGRVSAINYVFIGTSNELGGFESGMVAGLFGPVFSVVSGGIATILTVLATGAIWPQLRNLDYLHEPPQGKKSEEKTDAKALAS